MNSTALGAENIIFISDAHEKFYYEKLKEVSSMPERLSLIMFIWTCEGKSPYLREPRQLWKEIIYLQQSEGMQRS